MTTTTCKGANASPGVGIGPAFVVPSVDPSVPPQDEPETAFRSAAQTAADDLGALAERAEQAGRDEAAEILRAQALMANDPMLAERVAEQVATGVDLESALRDASEEVAEELLASGSDYLAERATDVREIARRIRFALAGVPMTTLSALTEPSVVVARALTAADTAAMEPELVRGFVTEEGGPTGHVAVIARSLRIPAVVAVSGATETVATGEEVIVDGGAGQVVIRPDAETRVAYEAAAEAFAARLEAAQQYKGVGVEVDGRKMSIAANVGNPSDIETAVEEGADGVGLYRTEFLFLDRAEPPTEDEQVEVYRQALAAFEEPVVIRTFDIGGDKPADYLEVPFEENPFLGVRGMRLYAQEHDLALTQARALLRAASSGELWVMAPMVTTVDDAIAMRQLFDTAAAALDAEGLEHGPVKLGIMVEVPSAALNAVGLARVVDFFSIGTNDLSQYTLAVDRTSAPLAHYMDAADPAVLRLCAMTAEAGSQAGVSVSVCGEAAADPGLALLFAAMGMDKLSVTAPAVNLIKKSLAEVDPTTLQPLLDQCLAAASPQEVRELLSGATIE